MFRFENKPSSGAKKMEIKLKVRGKKKFENVKKMSEE